MVVTNVGVNTVNFKFQSDSINTTEDDDATGVRNGFKFQSDSINTDGTEKAYLEVLNFKFQSDSINTSLLSGL